MWQNSKSDNTKTENVKELKNPKCDKNSQTQNVTTLKKKT